MHILTSIKALVMVSSILLLVATSESNLGNILIGEVGPRLTIIIIWAFLCVPVIVLFGLAKVYFRRKDFPIKLSLDSNHDILSAW